MRKIIFRGKLKLDGVWVYWNEYGELTTVTGKPRRQEIQYKQGQTTFYTHIYQIKSLLDRDTVGQYISRDKNKNPIFDGDVVSIDLSSKRLFVNRALLFISDEGVLCWKNEHFKEDGCAFVHDNGQPGFPLSACLVIGNRYDDTQLVEGIK